MPCKEKVSFEINQVSNKFPIFLTRNWFTIYCV